MMTDKIVTAPFSKFQPYDIEPIEVDETNDEILVINLKNQHAEDGYFAHRPQENHRFRYSKVFDGASPQQEVFEEIVKPVIDGYV